ncbi:hypothetical protein [Geomonas subterranea]|uniref:Uncharacterized protein n=1 Tax=Geomonas subterranea TaxID=2847989 RepID=A0ABX8LGE6_9BACT|nr:MULTISPECIES: hypothetical protein [Geomonas]QXE89759.1 hypothetical protein KP001_15160 [Geomonas subterranea]QXM08123.1 hypothetical protein KP002_14120 [Geomonas subterranea]
MKTATVMFLLLSLAGTAGADDLVCRGNIVSTQGEGIVARKHRFEVADVTGSDIQDVLEKCRRIALERQARAARKNPGGNFTSVSEVELRCAKGTERIEVRRRLQTR